MDDIFIIKSNNFFGGDLRFFPNATAGERGLLTWPIRPLHFCPSMTLSAIVSPTDRKIVILTVSKPSIKAKHPLRKHFWMNLIIIAVQLWSVIKQLPGWYHIYFCSRIVNLMMYRIALKVSRIDNQLERDAKRSYISNCQCMKPSKKMFLTGTDL